MQKIVETRIKESIEVKQKILQDNKMIASIYESAEIIRKSLDRGGKILLCGNGGSASDAMHLAGEFIGRFQKERKSLPAIALNAEIAAITAIGNDYSYECIFSRAVEGLLNEGDILIGISTSGNSENVYQAMLKAKQLGGITIALLGKNGGKIKTIADISYIVPSDCTARIQEAHIMIGHIICELVEEDI